jgi:hypothetical protein
MKNFIVRSIKHFLQRKIRKLLIMAINHYEIHGSHYLGKMLIPEKHQGKKYFLLNGLNGITDSSNSVTELEDIAVKRGQRKFTIAHEELNEHGSLLVYTYVVLKSEEAIQGERFFSLSEIPSPTCS